MVAVRHLPLVAVGISLLLGTADHVLGMANSSRSPIFWPPKISEHSNIENPSNVWTESNGQTPNLVDTHLKLHDFLVAFGVHRPRERFGSGAFAGARYCGTFPLENPFSGDAGPSRYDAAAAPGLRLILDHLLPSSAARLSRKHGLWLVHRIFHDGL